MSRLRNLQYLYLNDNQLSGPLPRWLASSRIWALGIGNNSFWGDLRALNGISRLVYFTAHNNQLAGPLPDFVATGSAFADLMSREIHFQASFQPQ